MEINSSYDCVNAKPRLTAFTSIRTFSCLNIRHSAAIWGNHPHGFEFSKSPNPSSKFFLFSAEFELELFPQSPPKVLENEVDPAPPFAGFSHNDPLSPNPRTPNVEAGLGGLKDEVEVGGLTDVEAGGLNAGVGAGGSFDSEDHGSWRTLTDAEEVGAAQGLE